MLKKIITNETITEAGKEYLIQPHHINAQGCFRDAFGDGETENSARSIVGLCQKNGGWFPFTKKEINQDDSCFFKFNGLSKCKNPMDQRNYVILGEDGKYRVTHEFIASCFKSSGILG